VDLWIMQLAFILKSVMYIYVTDRFIHVDSPLTQA